MMEHFRTIKGIFERSKLHGEIERFRDKLHKAQVRSDIELLGETKTFYGNDSAINYQVFGYTTDTTIRTWLKMSDHRSYISHMSPKNEISPYLEVSTKHFIIDVDLDSDRMNVFTYPPDKGMLIQDTDNEFKWVDVEGSLDSMPLIESNLITVSDTDVIATILHTSSDIIGHWVF